jgi:lipid-binding SYLF domain-containing protein
MFIRSLVITFITLIAFSSPVLAGSEASDDKAALDELMKSDVVSKFHKTAYGYAVFPTIGKGGIGFGGAHGKGRVYKAGKKTGDVSMTQLTIGLQLGGQAYRQVIYLEDKRAFEDFTGGSFEFSAQAEAIAITASAGAQAGSEGSSASANENQANARYHGGMVVFTQGKGGLMYQATIGGQKYDYIPSK